MINKNRKCEKYTDREVGLLRALINAGVKQEVLSELFGISQSHLSEIVNLKKRLNAPIIPVSDVLFYKNRDGALSYDKVRRIRLYYKLGFTQLDIAKIFGVHYSTVGNIIRGKTWTQSPETVPRVTLVATPMSGITISRTCVR